MNEKAIGQLSGLAGRLVAEGLISAQAASQAQKDASLERMPYVQYLVEKKNVNSQRLAEVASHEFGVPLFDLSAFNITAMPEGLVDVSLVTKHHALPLMRRGNRLFELGLSEVGLALCAASSKTDQTRIADLVAEHGQEGFLAAWLRDRGVEWAAELIPDLTNLIPQTEKESQS